MRTPTTTAVCLLALAAICGAASAGNLPQDVKPLSIAVATSGIKSHTIAIFGIVEALHARGHSVTLVVPTGDAEQTVATIAKDLELRVQPVGPTLSNIHPPKYDSWAEALWNARATYGKIGSIARQLFDYPYDDTLALFERERFDVVVSTFAATTAMEAARSAGIPYVGVAHVGMSATTMAPTWYPSMHGGHKNPALWNGMKLQGASFLQRFMNDAINRIGMTILYSALPNLWVVREVRSRPGTAGPISRINGGFDLLHAAPLIQFGGPPIQPAMPVPPLVSVIGAAPYAGGAGHMAPELLAFLDTALAEGRPVVYISMGTIFKMSDQQAHEIFEQLGEHAGISVLWSLRQERQEELRAKEDMFEHVDPTRFRLETFTPQPGVLAHPAVKVFVSHCGYGGYTDALMAGVPILGLPQAGDQHYNAQRIVERGAGLKLNPDLSALRDGVDELLENGTYASRMAWDGNALKSYGGAPKAADVIERAAADGLGAYDHLVLPGRDMTTAQIYGVDIMAAYAGVGAAAAVGLTVACRACRWAFACGVRRRKGPGRARAAAPAAIKETKKRR